jgi:hypothetical protein
MKLDHASKIFYIARLLRRMRRHLTSKDQLELCESLEAVILQMRALKLDKQQPQLLSPSIPRPTVIYDSSSSLPVMVRGVFGGYVGVPVIRKLDIVLYVFIYYVF